MKIKEALNAAMRDLAKIGIGKTQKNTQQGYHFRGIEQAMNELSPIMVNNGIVLQFAFTDLAVRDRERLNAKNEKAYTTISTVRCVASFSTVDDPEKWTVEAYGEAHDTGDKSILKAQSVAFRTVIFDTFMVPTMSMDAELDSAGDIGEDAEISGYRDAAMQGTEALRKYKAEMKPSATFWTRHSKELKDAAAVADKAPT